MSKFVQFTSVHFADLNPNSYNNLSNMKLDLNCAKCLPRSNLASANDQGLLKFKNRVTTGLY